MSYLGRLSTRLAPASGPESALRPVIRSQSPIAAVDQRIGLTDAEFDPFSAPDWDGPAASLAEQPGESASIEKPVAATPRPDAGSAASMTPPTSPEPVVAATASSPTDGPISQLTADRVVRTTPVTRPESVKATTREADPAPNETAPGHVLSSPNRPQASAGKDLETPPRAILSASRGAPAPFTPGQTALETEAVASSLPTGAGLDEMPHAGPVLPTSAPPSSQAAAGPAVTTARLAPPVETHAPLPKPSPASGAPPDRPAVESFSSEDRMTGLGPPAATEPAIPLAAEHTGSPTPAVVIDQLVVEVIPPTIGSDSPDPRLHPPKPDPLTAQQQPQPAVSRIGPLGSSVSAQVRFGLRHR